MKLAWGSHPRVDAAFRAAVLSICSDVGIADPSELMACMAFETGETFDPAKRNPASGATGLIQFMSSTATGLGTTTDALARMTAVQQLAKVREYLEPYKGRFANITDVYMAILWPAAVGKSDETVLFAKDDEHGKAYVQNKGLDLNQDGQITKAEATARVMAEYDKGLQPPHVFETEEGWIDRAKEIAATRDAIQAGQREEKPMPIAISLLTALIPQVLALFAPRAQAQVQRVTGADPDAAAAFYQSLIQKVGQVVNVPVVSDQTAVQAVAAITANPEPAKVQALEDHSLDFIDKMAPLLDKMVEIREREVKIEDASADAAAARADSAKVRQQFQGRAWWALVVGSAIIAAIACVQVYITEDHQADAAIVGALIFAFGQIVAWIGNIAHYGYGSSGGSGAKDAVISQMAKNR